MSETRLILGLARRETRERARSKAFQISTLILLLAAVAAVFLPTLFDLDGEPASYRVGIVGTAPAGLDTALTAALPDEATAEIVAFDHGSEAEAALAAEEHSLDVLLTDAPGLVWQQEPDPQLQAVLQQATTQLAIANRAETLGIETDAVGDLLAPVELTSTSLQEPPERRGPQALIATIGMVLLFVSITFYGSYILMSVIEEKQNRVVEVLLAHVDPRDLLAAKVLGHGALGLAQILALALIATVGLVITDPVDVNVGAAYGSIASAVLWFLLGYAFYSILYGALGSLASRTEDAQSAIGPLTIVLMAAYFTTFLIIDNPDGPVALVGSFLPPTAPMIMPLRTALTDVPLWQPALAVVIELAAIVGLVWLGGRLYRGAVLRVGRKLSLREAWNATT